MRTPRKVVSEVSIGRCSSDRYRRTGQRTEHDRAPGADDCDFVSRYFAPAVGIPEGPVTASAHCTLGAMTDHQLWTRGGRVDVRLRNGRVDLSGRAGTVTRGFKRRTNSRKSPAGGAALAPLGRIQSRCGSVDSCALNHVGVQLFPQYAVAHPT